MLAYNEWPGMRPLPSIRAAFVMPNHRVLVPLQQDTARALAAATGSSALNDDHQRDPARALAIMAAVHEELRMMAGPRTHQSRFCEPDAEQPACHAAQDPMAACAEDGPPKAYPL
ncbi:MAG: hypothetical protein ABIP94_20885 [Planctomycetota bacterium]